MSAGAPALRIFSSLPNPRLAKATIAAGLAPLYGSFLRERHPRAIAHFDRLCAHPAFAPDPGPYLEKYRG